MLTIQGSQVKNNKSNSLNKSDADDGMPMMTPKLTFDENTTKALDFISLSSSVSIL